MNGRSNFRRLQHWQLAERQRYLAELESLDARLCADIDALRGRIGEAEALPATQAGDTLFLRPLVDRRDKLLRSVAEIQSQIVEAREALAAAESELKLVEGSLVPHGAKFEDRMTRRARRSL